MDLTQLNDAQREAVCTLSGPLLVLAGAGSGKTRVLTYRIANLIENGVAPWNILALTFTNKAAREMKERTELLIGSDANDMWVTTFHSCCARILRLDIDKIGFEKTFIIYDDADQMSVVSDIIKQMELSEDDFPKRYVKEMIGDAKSKSLSPEDYFKDDAWKGDTLLTAFRLYQKKLKAANALDFDDLLLKTIELFEKNPDVLRKYRNKFRHVLVDEYQDTNLAQYRLIQLLCREHGNICVVGDDDQSIYGWRGADIRNILGFEQDFPGARVVRLEQNYRSTGIILDAANGVIENNQARKAKRLWTAKQGGDCIELYNAPNERMEADFVCRKILHEVNKGRSYDDFAVLYRMNAQSRVLGLALDGYHIRYRVYGGVKFYDRKEVKDIIAYLRVIYNPADDVSLKRIINVPRRGLGESAVEELERKAAAEGAPMLIAAMRSSGFSGRVKQKLEDFAKTMADLIAMKECMSLPEFVEHLIRAIEYDRMLLENKRADYEDRMQILFELIGDIREKLQGVPDDTDQLPAYLENISLMADIDSMTDGSGAVSLMTLHSAKGLEFPVVFIVGMEDNIFPSSRARADFSKMEEERRLCYVGITRAKEKLYFVNAQQRSLFGDYSANRPSQFLSEIPPELLSRNEFEQTDNVQDIKTRYEPRMLPEEKNMHQGFGTISAKGAKSMPDRNYKLYQKVSHAKFGEGTVVEVSGAGSSQLVSIDFFEHGVKKFAAAYAPITVLDE